MAAPRAKIGTAWLDVAISMEGIGDLIADAMTTGPVKSKVKKAAQKVGAEAGGQIGEEAGKKAGEALGKGFKDGANEAVSEIDKIKGEIDGIFEDLEVEAADLLGEDLGDDLGDAAGELGAGFGTKFLGAIAALGIGVAIGKALGDGFKEAMDRQNTDKITEAALGLTEAEAEKLSGVAKNLYSSAYGETYEQVSEALRAITGSVKGAREASAEELETMAKDVLNLGTAYGVSSEEILKAVQSQISSGFAGSWNEAVNNVLSGFQKLGANGADYFETLNEYSDDFATLGLNGVQAVDLVNNALAAGARNTDVFADALQEFQIRLGDTSSFDALSTLGFDPQEIQSQIAQGGEVASSALNQVWSKLQETGDRDLFGQIFGTQAEDYFSVFNTIDLGPLTSGVGQLEDQMKNFDETLNSGASVSLENFQRLIGEVFVDLMQPVLEALTPVLADFAKFISENEEAATALAIVIGGVLLLALVAITAALWAMIAPVLANPLTWIILAIVVAVGLLIAGIIAIAMHWEEIVAKFAIGAQQIGEFFAGVGQFLIEVWNNVVTFLVEAVTWWVDANVAAIQWIMEAFASAGAAIAGFFSSIWEGIVAAVTTWVEWNLTAMENLISGFFSFGEALLGFFTSVGETIINFIIGAANTAIDTLNWLSDSMNEMKWPDWLGGGKIIPWDLWTIPNIPAMATGGTIAPTPGGTIVRVAEAGKAESIVDTGLVNKALREGIAGNGAPQAPAGDRIINLYPPEGMDIRTLIEEINDFMEFNDTRSGEGYSYA